MNPDPTAIPIEFDPQKQRMVGVATHGMTPFDVPFISELAPNLWQGGCQNGLILPEFIDHLVSLYPWEQYTVQHDLSSALTVRMYDSLDQAYDQVDAIAAWVNEARKSGVVLVHCQAGLNRSSLVATRALMLGGMTADEAIKTVRSKRSPACLCNPAFESHLRGIGMNTPRSEPLDTQIDELCKGQGHMYGGTIRKEIKDLVTKAALEARNQGALNALTQLKIDRINHTLGTHPDEWTREVDFIDEHIAALGAKQPK